MAANQKGLTAERFAAILIETYFRLHGLPDVIVSDRDPRFTGWQHLTKLWGTRTAMSTAFHPETDGQAEKANSIVERYLDTFAGIVSGQKPPGKQRPPAAVSGQPYVVSKEDIPCAGSPTSVLQHHHPIPSSTSSHRMSRDERPPYQQRSLFTPVGHRGLSAPPHLGRPQRPLGAPPP